MSKNDGIERIISDLKQYVLLLVNEGKFFLIESVSLIVAEFLAFLLLGLLLSIIFLMLLIGAVWLLSSYLGLPAALLIVVLSIFLVSVFVFIRRKHLFVDVVISCLCSVLFSDNEKHRDE